MKNLISGLLCTFLLCSSLHVSAQTAKKELAPGYYVVVGAYADTKESVAQRYVETLSKEGISADYGFNTGHGMYFVYLHYYTTLKESLKEMGNARKGKFSNAWVRVVPGDIGSSTPAEVMKPIAPAEIKKTEAVTENKEAETKPEPIQNSAVEMAADSSLAGVTENPEIKQYAHMTLGNTEVFLSLYNSRNNRIVDGEVQVIDTERARQIMKVKGNEYLLLPDPKSKTGQLTLLCNVFGYRKIQEEINYPFPLADTVKSYVDLVGTTIVINFDLVRYHQGDITPLYNVYFYNDAALMLPESKYELNNLLQMMQEDTKYRIRLHGHTNGNYHGKILSVGSENNFFSLNGAKETLGSAKDLSAARAEVIKNFLVTNKIDPSRIEIKAWGGKRPLYDKNNVNAKKNVRVEVEILEE